MSRRLRQLRRLVLSAALSAAVASAGLVSADATRPAMAALARALTQAAEPQAARLALRKGTSREISFTSAVAAAVVTDPAVAAASVTGARSVTLSGLSTGDTLLIVTTEAGREVYAVAVSAPARKAAPAAARGARRSPGAPDGFYGVTLARPAGRGGFSLAHTLDLSRNLGGGRRLRAGADFFSDAFAEAGDRFSAQRLSLSLDGKAGSLELLDSSVPSTWPAGGGFGLRGARFTAAPGSAREGLDLFAGVSRTNPSAGRGVVAGALVPLARSETLLLRAGALYGATRPGESPGPRAVAELRYAPTERTTFAATAGGGAGGPSWGARLDLRRDTYGVSAEAARGVTSAGARAYYASAYWSPAASLRGSARWHSFDAGRGHAATSTLAASVNYTPARHSRFGLSLSRTEGGPAGGGYANASYLLNLGAWSNTLEARFGRTGAQAPGTRPDSLTYVSEQLRRQWGRWSLAGGYSHLRRDAGRVHADTTREAGGSLRAAFERVRIEGGAYYKIFESGGAGVGGVRAAGAVSLRLDPYNSLRFGLSRGVGSAPASTGLTFSLTHRFGGGAFGLSKLSRLLGRGGGGGHVSGVVFRDDNGNGTQDRGEAGVANMRVTLDGGRREATTDAGGGFRFGAGGGRSVELADARVGVSLLASTPTAFSLGGGEERRPFSFGVTDSSSLGGRVVNDLGSGEASAWPGLPGVRLRLLRGGAVVESVTNSAGYYRFTNLRPGDYTLEIAADTLPPNFRLPDPLVRPVTLNPVTSENLDLTLYAERAVYGRVFSDRDGDGAFIPGVDSGLAGIVVEFAGRSTTSDAEGAYMLRGLPAGGGTLSARRGDATLYAAPMTLGPGPSALSALIPVVVIRPPRLAGLRSHESGRAGTIQL